MIIAGVLLAMAGALAVAGRDLFRPNTRLPSAIESPNANGASDNIAAREDQRGAPPPSIDLIADDGQSMWASPTSGQPLAWDYLPPGAQIVLAVRPAALAAHPEGEKVLAALGPLGRDAIRFVEQETAVPFRQIDRLIVGWQADGESGRMVATLVVYADQYTAVAAASGEIDDRAGERVVHRPGRTGGPALVVAPAETLREISALAGAPPPLRRDVERLLAHTDADRAATLIVAPGFLFNEGRAVLAGPLSRLRQPLSWFLGDGLSAAAISLHWDNNFFVEVVAVPTLDTPTGRAAEQLAERVANLPERVEQYVVGLNPSPHSRRVVARLPAMTRKLATYMRSGFDRDHVMLRGYLPAVAGHNLLMATELTLAEPPGGAGLASTPGAPGRLDALTADGLLGPMSREVSPDAVRDALQRVTSLRMPRDSLEAALAQLAAGMGVKIVIRGGDLQIDGITKNQSLAIDMANRPAEDILVEILRLANPDKMATGPGDPRQKLVYVIGPIRAGEPLGILVTTRARVAERGETLPAVFRSEN
jgi:hypothetical protein